MNLRKKRNFPHTYPNVSLAGEVSSSNAETAGTESKPEPLTREEQDKLFRQLGTELWRLKKKMTDSSGEPLEEMKRAIRHLRSAMDLLDDAGVEIFDHTGKQYD